MTAPSDKDREEALQLLRDCKEKLEVYYEATGARYSGGLPCNDLIKRLERAIARGAVPESQPPTPQQPATLMDPHTYAYWLADKIPALGDYAKEAAQVLRRQADQLLEVAEECNQARLEQEPLRTEIEHLREQLASRSAIGQRTELTGGGSASLNGWPGNRGTAPQGVQECRENSGAADGGERPAPLSTTGALTDGEAMAKVNALCERTDPRLLVSVLKGELWAAWTGADRAAQSSIRERNVDPHQERHWVVQFDDKSIWGELFATPMGAEAWIKDQPECEGPCVSVEVRVIYPPETVSATGTPSK